MNKLTIGIVKNALKKYEAIIKAKPQIEMQKLFDSLDMTLEEVAFWQTKKNIAMLSGKLDEDTALLIYNELNGWLHKKALTTESLALRVVLTQVFARIR